MTTQSLTEQIRDKASFLCVGLDSDLAKLPPAVRNHPEAQFTFNKAIIEATHDLAVAYKINTAFYESCLLYTSPSPRDATLSRMPSSA